MWGIVHISSLKVFSYIFSTTVVIKACEPIFTLFLTFLCCNQLKVAVVELPEEEIFVTDQKVSPDGNKFHDKGQVKVFCAKFTSVFFIVAGASAFSAQDVTLHGTGETHNWFREKLFLFVSSRWHTKGHIGRSTRNSDPVVWHLPQVVQRVVQTTGSVYP